MLPHIGGIGGDQMRRFMNRTEAGRELATMLQAFAGRSDVIVLGLPRGGVPVAFEVAKALHAPLDVFNVRKLGAPANEEFAIGAIATGDVTTIDWRAVDALRITRSALDRVIASERGELARRDRLYRGNRPGPPIAGRTVIIVDDGLATGSTMFAAVTALRTLHPARIVVATPVASYEADAMLRTVADACICAYLPAQLYSVGQWYEEFTQTTDEEVLDLLRRASQRSTALPAADTTAGAWYA
jgi:putative phosphoribosyl transferase